MDTFARMRCTAALLSCTPAISARLVHEDVIIVEVMRPPFPTREHAVLPPCWFRGLVAEAIAADAAAGSPTHDRMTRLALCRTDLGTRDGAVLLPAEVVRVEAGTSWMHLHAVSAPVADVDRIARTAAEELGEDPDDLPLELHAARDLRATVLAQASPRTAAASDAAADLLRTIAVRVAIERLERELACRADHPARRSRAPHRTDDGSS